MSERIGLFAGSFDPLTLGHVDIVRKALTIFDRVIVLVADDPFKRYTLTGDDRLAICRADLADLGDVNVMRGHGLTAQMARELGACALIRGLRTAADFNDEYRMALVNENIVPGLETVFLLTDPVNCYISSAMVKSLLISGGNIDQMVPPHCLEVIKAKLSKKD